MKPVTKKRLSAIAAAAMCAAVFASCKSGAPDSGDASQSVTESVSAGTPEAVTIAADPNAAEAGVPVNLEEGVSDKMYGRAIMSEGNKVRLAHAMKKAQNGEEVTVGVIEPPITRSEERRVGKECT